MSDLPIIPTPDEVRAAAAVIERFRKAKEDELRALVGPKGRLDAFMQDGGPSDYHPDTVWFCVEGTSKNSLYAKSFAELDTLIERAPLNRPWTAEELARDFGPVAA